MKEDTYEHITEKRRRYHTGFGRFQTAVKSADLSGGKDRCGQCGGVCPSDPDPESGEHGEGDPCPGQQCWWGDQLRSHDLRCDPGKPGTGRALLHRTCVQHGGRDRCVRIAWKIYPAAWGDDDP